MNTIINGETKIVKYKAYYYNAAMVLEDCISCDTIRKLLELARYSRESTTHIHAITAEGNILKWSYDYINKRMKRVK